jgi:hypothetical protein
MLDHIHSHAAGGEDLEVGEEALGRRVVLLGHAVHVLDPDGARGMVRFEKQKERDAKLRDYAQKLSSKALGEQKIS